MLLLNVNTNVMLESQAEAKSYLIVPAITTLQQKIWKVGNIWVVDAMYLVIVFVLSYSSHNILHRFLCFVVNLSAIALFLLDKCFNFSNSLS